MCNNSLFSLSCFVALFSSSRCQNVVGSVYMRDLGMPEPHWIPYSEGTSLEPALTVNSDTQFWGSIQPESSASAPLCKWFAGKANSGHGSCKTDISWLLSAVGIRKEFFDDPVTNYVLRFHMNSACYRSTQVRTHKYAGRSSARE
jgi:hypothetical protein